MNRRCVVALLVVAITLLCAAQPPLPPAPDDQITVKELVIKGGNALSYSQLRDARASVEGRTGTMVNLMDAARESLTASLKSDCYLVPDVEMFTAFAQDASTAVVMHAAVREGVRYTLRNFRIEWDKTLSQQIEHLLPLDAMRRGDCQGLNELESTVSQYYRKHGYPNIKLHPLIQTNSSIRQFDLTLYIDEGTRSH